MLIQTAKRTEPELLAAAAAALIFGALSGWIYMVQV